MFITNHERNTQFSPFGHCNLHNQYAVKPEYRFYTSTGLNQLEIASGNLNGNLLLKLQIKNSIFQLIKKSEFYDQDRDWQANATLLQSVP